MNTKLSDIMSEILTIAIKIIAIVAFFYIIYNRFVKDSKFFLGAMFIPLTYTIFNLIVYITEDNDSSYDL